MNRRDSSRIATLAQWERLLRHREAVPDLVLAHTDEGRAIVVTAQSEPTSDEIERYLVRVLQLIREGRTQMVEAEEGG